MNYLIDYDTRSVEAKGEDAEVLASYILDNDLNLAVALVSGSDDLEFQFSLEELQDLYDNLIASFEGRAKEFESTDEASELISHILNVNDESFPTFTQSLGKKLIKAGNTRSKDRAEPNPEKPKRQSKGKVGTRLKGDTMVSIGAQPKESTLPYTIWSIVDDNLGEMSVDDIIAEGGDAKQITRCLRKGFLIRQEEEEL